MPTAAPGFESQSHRDQFARWLKDRAVPLKFAYTGTAALTHDRLARSGGYQQVIGQAQDEVELYRRAVAAANGTSRIVEIGPGNGVHSVGVLQGIAGITGGPRRYLAADFSRSLLDAAISRIIAECGSGYEISHGLWDIEEGPTSLVEEWRDSDHPVSFCMFGNTLGNVESPIGVLEHIGASGRSGDTLVISVTLAPSSPDDDAVLEPYNTEVFHAAVLEMFAMAGIPRDILRLEIGIVEDTVIGNVEVLRPVTFDYVDLEPGERLRCFRSRRFRAGEVRTILDLAGWIGVDEINSGGHLVIATTRK